MSSSVGVPRDAEALGLRDDSGDRVNVDDPEMELDHDDVGSFVARVVVTVIESDGEYVPRLGVIRNVLVVVGVSPDFEGDNSNDMDSVPVNVMDGDFAVNVDSDERVGVTDSEKVTDCSLLSVIDGVDVRRLSVTS